MFNFLMEIPKFLLGLGLANLLWKWWNKIPDSLKREIIDSIIKAFEVIFRAYYKSYKSG